MKKALKAEACVKKLRRVRRGMTYGDLLEFKQGGTCPWQRLKEAGHKFLKAGEKIISYERKRDGLIEFRIINARSDVPDGVRIINEFD